MPVLSRAKVGQWARYRSAGGFEQRLEVVDVTRAKVHLRLQMWLDGRPAGLPTIREEPIDVDWVLRAATRDKATVTSRPTTLRVAERDWPTRLTIARWRLEGVEYERRTWISSDAPIYGLVRMDMTAGDALEASMELIDFGDSTSPAKKP
ncbi:MAG: hypothetical protein JXQ73_16210 [Phycisphaerae bacterium]|nr:hypothetical protein [Phycisphaerae bacterium]